MYTSDQGAVVRVPSGWNQFYDVINSKGKSSIKDPSKGRVLGLHYDIKFIKPLIERQKISSSFYISINSWHYNIYNEWHEYPVLSFLIQDRMDKKRIITDYVSDIKIMSYAFPIKITLVHRLLTATSFFIKRIDNDIVPDVEQILRLHKIHPTQRSFYQEQSAEDIGLLNNLRQRNDNSKREMM